MIDVISQKALIIWNMILSAAVSLHFVFEVGHYLHEYFSQRKRRQMLSDIHQHVETLEELHKFCREQCPLKNSIQNKSSKS